MILATPDIVNPANPPKIPAMLPPKVAASMNNIAQMIVPYAPATAAFHKPPNIPSWAM